MAVLPSFDNAKVSDAMRPGVFWCPPETHLAGLAQTMVSHLIHCVIIGRFEGEDESDRPWGIVSDLDVVATAARDAPEEMAWSVARRAPVTITADDSLRHAAETMAEHQLAHLVVVQPESGQPLGVLSTLDIAGVLARSDT